MSGTRPEAIGDLRVTGEDGRRITLSIMPWTGKGGSDTRSLYVTVKAAGGTPLGFFIDEDDIALGADDALFLLAAWLTHRVS